jgi:hypothetical protein
MGLVGVRRAPHLEEELAMRQDFPGVADERGEQSVFDWREMHWLPGDGHLPLGEVHVQIVQRECGLAGIIRVAGGVPQGRAHARQQLADPEGLAHVVIGAGIEGGDLVPLLASRREHNDRQGGPFTQPADDIESVDVGEAEIENHNVGLARCRLDEAGLPRGRFEETVSVIPQGCAQEASDLRIIFDDKDGWLPA